MGLKIPESATLLMHFDESIEDKTGKNIPSMYGTEAYGEGRFKNAIKPSGSSCVKIPYSENVNLASGDWTIAGWFYREKVNTGWECLFSSRGRYNDSYTQSGLYIALQPDGVFCLHLNTTYSSSCENKSVSTTTYFPVNVWTHIALVKSGQNLFFFVNGVLLATLSLGTATIYNPSTYFIIGGAHDQSTNVESTSDWFNGMVDEFIIAKEALWTEDFDPYDVPWGTPDRTFQPGIVGKTNVVEGAVIPIGKKRPANTTLLMHFDEDIEDAINLNNPFLSSGTEVYAEGKFKNAFKFNGSNCVKIPYNANAFGFTNDDWTIAGWFYREKINTGWECLFSSRRYYDRYNPYSGFNLSLNDKGNFEVLVFTTYYTSIEDVTISSTTNFPVNTWTHIALVKSGQNVMLFVNGKLLLTKSLGTASIYNPQTYFYIGGSHDQTTNVEGTAEFFNGFVDEFIIVKEALWTEDFAPPTRAYA